MREGGTGGSRGLRGLCICSAQSVVLQLSQWRAQGRECSSTRPTQAQTRLTGQLAIAEHTHTHSHRCTLRKETKTHGRYPRQANGSVTH